MSSHIHSIMLYHVSESQARVLTISFFHAFPSTLTQAQVARESALSEQKLQRYYYLYFADPGFVFADRGIFMRVH